MTNNTSTLKKKELDKYELELRNPGYLYIKHKSNIRFELEDAKQQVLEIESFCQGKSYPFLIDLRVNNWDAPKEVRDFHSTNQKLLSLRRAECILVNNLGLKLMANFYQKFHPSKNPLRVFTNEEKAKKWIDKFITPPIPISSCIA